MDTTSLMSPIVLQQHRSRSSMGRWSDSESLEKKDIKFGVNFGVKAGVISGLNRFRPELTRYFNTRLNTGVNT